jgi:hypothetical protein
MKQVVLAAALTIATAAQAQGTNPNSHPVQAYTTLGPAGAGGLCGAAAAHQSERRPDQQLRHPRQCEPEYRRRRHAESALLIDCLPLPLDTPPRLQEARW